LDSVQNNETINEVTYGIDDKINRVV